MLKLMEISRRQVALPLAATLLPLGMCAAGAKGGRVLAGFDATTLSRARDLVSSAQRAIRYSSDGLDPHYLKRLTSYWAMEWDWDSINRTLNRLDLVRHGQLQGPATRSDDTLQAQTSLPVMRIGEALDAARLGNSTLAILSPKRSFPVSTQPLEILRRHLSRHNRDLAGVEPRTFTWDFLLLDVSVDWLWKAVHHETR